MQGMYGDGDGANSMIERLLALVRERYFGKYRGVVASSTADPTKRGRVEVRVPAVLGDQAVWAMPCVPYAGKGVGLHMLPPEGAGVWVEFESGDCSYPIWTGCYWASNDIEPIDSDPAIKFIKTDKVTIRIDDNKGEIVIENSTGSRITMQSTSIEIKSIEVNSISGATKASVGPGKFSVNNGALDVV